MSDVAGQSVMTAVRLGLKAGDTVGEAGYDDDVDHDLRDAVADLVGSDLLDEDADDVLDAVLIGGLPSREARDDSVLDCVLESVPALRHPLAFGARVARRDDAWGRTAVPNFTSHRAVHKVLPQGTRTSPRAWPNTSKGRDTGE